MARYRGSNCRVCRAKGERLFLKGKRCGEGKCSFNKRPYPPGTQGQRLKTRKISDYGKELAEKQKAKHIYGILEGQFKNYFKKAKAKAGLCGENLLIFLERRLDNVVYRAGFSPTRAGARQMVTHNHIKVKGKKMNIPSYLVKISDIIEVDKELEAPVFNIPAWFKLDGKKIEIIKYPERKEITTPIEEDKIVSLYSK